MTPSIEPAGPLARLVGLAPIWSPAARVLVLGSFPSVASLQAQQYYGHPRNHFWRILGALWGQDLPARPYAERVAAAQAHGLAIWDVYASCERQGSLDAAIRQPVVNDLPALVSQMPNLQAIAHNGGESARNQRLTATLGLPVYVLPSTSPANASWSFERKREAWGQVLARHGWMNEQQ